MEIPLKYINKLSKKDEKKQIMELKKSRNQYKKGIYYNRKFVKSFTNKKSSHIENAKKTYKVNRITASPELSKKTGCSIESLEKIINKGMGAYYSSGSRPNQSAQSWGYSRLASAITGKKASVIDFDIIKNGCNKNGKTYKLALKGRKKYGKIKNTQKIKV